MMKRVGPLCEGAAVVCVAAVWFGQLVDESKWVKAVKEARETTMS